MKHLKNQIKFIDTKLLPIFGFKNILDYSHILCITDVDDLTIDLNKLNELINEFRKTFHSKNFSLHKTQYKIQTKSQAICLLKTCLEVTSIPHDISLKKNKKYLRLISKNNILEEYINTLKMAEYSSFELVKSDFNESSFLKKYNFNDKLTKKHLNEGIKKITKYDFYLNPKKILKNYYKNNNTLFKNTTSVLSIDLKKYNLSDKTLKSLKVQFVSKKINSYQIISDVVLNHLVKDLNYVLRIGDEICWGSKFDDSNFLIDDVLIPTKSLHCHEILFQIINIQEIINLLDNLELKVEVEYVDLYSELDKIITSVNCEQEICMNEKYNTLMIMHGMAGMRFHNFMTKEQIENLRLTNVNKLKKDVEISDNLNNFHIDDIGEKNTIYGIDGCYILDTNKIFKLNIKNFFEQNNKINFISVDRTYKIDDKLFYNKVITNDIFEHNYIIEFNMNDDGLDLCFIDIYNKTDYINTSCNLISKLEIILPNIDTNNICELIFKYDYKSLKNPENSCCFTVNINVNDIKNNILKIDLNNFIFFSCFETNINLLIKTKTTNEPIGNEIFISTREHFFKPNVMNTKSI